MEKQLSLGDILNLLQTSPQLAACQVKSNCDEPKECYLTFNLELKLMNALCRSKLRKIVEVICTSAGYITYYLTSKCSCLSGITS